MTGYHLADTQAQWFEDDYPGAVMDPNCVVLHTTEGTSWPGYSGGAVAPNYTAQPDMHAKCLRWRQHYPDERSARALENDRGGVETNTLNVVQVELVGTCNPQHRHRWGNLRAGVDYIYWPDAPEWALLDLAHFLVDQHQRHGTKLVTPKPFKAYPGSYGTRNGVRMSQRQWLNFYGICGHQHVPENVHGDPGDLPMDAVLQHAVALAQPGKHKAHKPAPAPVPTPAAPTRVDNARALGDQLLEVLTNAVDNGRRGTVKDVRDNIKRQLARLPKH